MTSEPSGAGPVLESFTLVMISEVKKLILKSTKLSILDPIPAWLLKDCVNELCPLICNIINSSIESSVVPGSFKRAQICPLLKKNDLDKELLGNYRPVSNLPFLSKILERVVAQQLDKYFLDNDLLDSHQSAYRQYHSTETALVKVHSDITECIDQGRSAVLIMLDLSSAFDTVDHAILLRRLRSDFGVCRKVLGWLSSNLHGRSQCVSVRGDQSAFSEVKHCVPQGSVLGPKLFSAYIRPVGDIVRLMMMISMFNGTSTPSTQSLTLAIPLTGNHDLQSQLFAKAATNVSETRKPHNWLQHIQCDKLYTKDHRIQP